MKPSPALVLFILIVLLATILVALATSKLGQTFAPEGRHRVAGGGPSEAHPRETPHGHHEGRHRVAGGGPSEAHPRDAPHDHHEVGLAIHKYARSLSPGHIIGPHPLDRDGYEPLARASHGGAAKKPAAQKKRWDKYTTWEALQADEGATAAYFEQRAAVLSNPNLDWGPVLADMAPKLKENREYIGIANLAADGRTLRIIASEASPLIAGETGSETSFAGVPGELVMKYASRPGLFLFHTHPADPRGSPLPSSHDLSTAIYFGATSRFAACAVISRYGVFVHGLDWSSYKAINAAKDWKLALLNYSHDIVAAHEAVRSWSAYSLAEYLNFYPRHRLLMIVYPSPEMVGDSLRFSYLWNLEMPIDYDLITEHINDIVAHREDLKTERRRGQTNAAFSPELTHTALGFD
jgi:hypothetical protein